jgi:protein TonB
MLKPLILIVILATATAASAKETPPLPKMNLASLITDEDYPASAERAKQTGLVGFTLAIGPNGRVTRCTIRRSSGFPALDSATCRLLTARARFVPARASDGTTRPGTHVGNYRWRLYH